MARPKPYRLLVTGSRDWPEECNSVIEKALTKVYEAVHNLPFLEPILVHGTAAGVDTIAAAHWISMGGTVEPHPADWDRWGRRAGYVRNADMVNAGADLCLAFIYNNSRGATQCAKLAERAGIKTMRVETGND